MPRTQRKSKAKESSSDSDSGPDDRMPVKKAKAEPAKTAKPSNASRAEDEEDSWEFGRNRLVKLTEFKNKWYVSIREYYMAADGEMKPSKKGIMINMEQWQKFKNIVPEIEEAIKRRV